MKRLSRIAIALSAAALAGGAFAADATPKDKQAERSGFERMDKNNDGYISPAEARVNSTLSKDFKKFDLNNDGKLNHAEYVAAAIKEDAVSAKDKVVEKVNKARSSNDASSGSTAQPATPRTPPPAETSK